MVPMAMVLWRRWWKRGRGGPDLQRPVSGPGLKCGRVPLSLLCGCVCGGAVARRETDEHSRGGRWTNDQPNIANGERLFHSFSPSLFQLVFLHFALLLFSLAFSLNQSYMYVIKLKHF